MPSLPTAGSCGNAPARGIWYSTTPDDVAVAASNNTTRLRISVPRQRDCCYTIVVLYCAPDRGNQPTRERRVGARPLRATGMLDIDLHDVARWLGRDRDATAWR